MSLHAALSTAARSLELFRTGIEVAGHNVANANTPGYVREDLILEAGPDYRRGHIIDGTGAYLTGTQMAVDIYLEHRLHKANTDLAGSQITATFHTQLQATLNELGAGDLSTGVNDLLGAINDWTNEPELAGLRETVLSQGEQFARDVTVLRGQLDTLRETATTQLEALVNEANDLIDRVEELNTRIVRVEAGGSINSDATGLRSERLLALNRLSEIVEIQVQEEPSGRVDVLSGGEYLILKGVHQHLEVFYDPDAPPPTGPDDSVSVTGVRYDRTKYEVLPGGEISGLLAGRDDVVGQFLVDLDEFVATLAFEMNRIHSQGQGTTGYTALTSEYAVDDPAAALAVAGEPAAGLEFAPEHGSFRVVLENAATGVRQTTQIDVDLDGLGADDTTLDDLALALDAVAGLNASVTANGRLDLSTDSGFELFFGEDTSGVVAALGLNTFFSGYDSQTIALNADLRAEPTRLAGGQGGGPSDNRNALALTELMTSGLASLDGRTLDEAYETIVFGVANDAAAATSIRDGFQAFQDSLLSQREQYSGVSLDEETVTIMKYQQSYQAAARMISTIDELMQILVNL